MKTNYEFISILDANIIYMKIDKEFPKVEYTLEDRLLFASNGTKLTKVIETVALNMQQSRPRRTYIYTIVYEGEKPTTYVSSEVLEKVFPVLLKRPLEDFQEILTKLVYSKRHTI